MHPVVNQLLWMFVAFVTLGLSTNAFGRIMTNLELLLFTILRWGQYALLATLFGIHNAHRALHGLIDDMLPGPGPNAPNGDAAPAPSSPTQQAAHLQQRDSEPGRRAKEEDSHGPKSPRRSEGMVDTKCSGMTKNSWPCKRHSLMQAGEEWYCDDHKHQQGHNLRSRRR